MEDPREIHNASCHSTFCIFDHAHYLNATTPVSLTEVAGGPSGGKKKSNMKQGFSPNLISVITSMRAMVPGAAAGA